jgi:hypothetical protein
MGGSIVFEIILKDYETYQQMISLIFDGICI